MSELKPCPLCGSEVRWVSGSIRCSRCGLSYGAPVSKEKVERRWNTRAERTCHMEWVPMFPGTDSPFMCWQCDVCDRTNEGGRKPNYCSNCGAKVVEE